MVCGLKQAFPVRVVLPLREEKMARGYLRCYSGFRLPPKEHTLLVCSSNILCHCGGYKWLPVGPYEKDGD